MPLKNNTDETQLLKIELPMMDHVRLIKYAKSVKATKRKTGAKIISDWLRKNVKLKAEEAL